jgi:hypothetical protein
MMLDFIRFFLLCQLKTSIISPILVSDVSFCVASGFARSDCMDWLYEIYIFCASLIEILVLPWLASRIVGQSHLHVRENVHNLAKITNVTVIFSVSVDICQK